MRKYSPALPVNSGRTTRVACAPAPGPVAALSMHSPLACWRLPIRRGRAHYPPKETPRGFLPGALSFHPPCFWDLQLGTPGSLRLFPGAGYATTAVIRAIRIHENGGPEVMRWESIHLPPPAAGEVRVRHTAIAVNFSDINVRRGGFYISGAQVFPLIPGNEAAGVVAGLGSGVK